ncbi:MAG: saccharopine dehydrogenase NADP-binding domain-containing protein [Pseudomonadota bacterium]|nr:saccharopine dehydrogenase NADP-binding domain-containing protein [Pseudomonadota bacterium]
MEWMIYGANGYTGELIAREAKRQGMTPVLAGRSRAKIAALASELKLPSKAFRLEAPSEIVAALRGVRLVLNCAGPFSKTADPLMRACLATKAHYLDITGEIDVLEGTHRFDADAKAGGVVLCPGAGFDVVPTDCIALMLKKALPEATELALGFELSGRRMSAGTAKTLVEGLGKSGKIRRAGRIVDCPLGRGTRRIDFGRGAKLAMPIPWGDVASAFYTTGIPDITVFTPISPMSLAIARLTNGLGPVLRSPRLQSWLIKKIERDVRGPDVSTREASPAWVWGEARDVHGRSHMIRIVTSNGYSLTVFSSLALAQHLMSNVCPPGCWTPAGLIGENFILSLPGASKLDLPHQTA